MVRRIAIVSLLTCLMVMGCEKKEPQPAPPDGDAQEARAPAGMVPVLTRPGMSVYVSETPVTVREYTEYLRATDQPVPERWTDVGAGDPEADEPITGLTKKQAELLAAWRLARIPTRQEWADWIQVNPYPWGPDGEPVAGAAIYLVRDWEPGTEAEQKARERKAELPERILARYREQVDELRAEVKDRADQIREEVADKWREVKPGIFAVLEGKKELARLQAQEKWRQEAVKVLQEVFKAKGKLAAALKAADLAPEEVDEAVQAYDQTLSSAVAKAQETQQKVQQEAQDLQSKVEELTKSFDESGRERAEVLPSQVESALEQTGRPADTVPDALRQENILRAALEAAESARNPLADLPAPEDLRRQAESVQEQIDSFTPDQELTDRMADLQQRLKSVGETIDREFEKEKVLLEELDAWVDLGARRDAIAAYLEALRQMIGEESGPE